MAKIQRLLSVIDRLEELARTNSSGGKAEGLDFFRQRLAEREIYVAIMGEFSVGKSYFINSLLKVPGLLPTGVAPTTSVITRCFQSSGAQPTVHFSDGSSLFAALEEARDVLTNGMYQGQAVDIVDLPVEIPLLNLPISIIDTPGIGSLNIRHQQMTIDFLPKVDLVIYLFTPSLGSTDLEFLEHILELNSQLLFVLTKTDIINTSEISIAELVQQTKDTLIKKKFIQEPVVLSVSAKRSLTGEALVPDGLASIEAYLIQEVAAKHEELLVSSQAVKLMRFVAKWEQETNLLHMMQQQSLAADRTQWEENSGRIAQELEHVQLSAEYLFKRLNHQAKGLSCDCKEKIELEQARLITQWRQQLNAPTNLVGLRVNEWERKLEQLMAERLAWWRRQAQSHGDGLIAYGGQVLQADLTGLSQSLEQLFGVTWQVDLPECSVLELVQSDEEAELNSLREQLELLSRNREELVQKLGYKEEELQELLGDLRVYKAELLALRQETAQLNYEPEYLDKIIENRGDAEGVLSGIGKNLDWIIFNLPTPGSIVKQLFEFGDKLGNQSKAGKVIQKINTNKKLLKAVRKVNKINGVSKQIQQQAQVITQTMPESQGRQTIIETLDLLSAEGILRRVGRGIDSVTESTQTIAILNQEHQESFIRLQQEQLVKNQQAQVCFEKRERAWRALQNEQHRLREDLEQLGFEKSEAETALSKREDKEKRRQLDVQLQQQRQHLQEALEQQISHFYQCLKEAIQAYLLEVAQFVTQSLTMKATDQVTNLQAKMEELRQASDTEREIIGTALARNDYLETSLAEANNILKQLLSKPVVPGGKGVDS